MSFDTLLSNQSVIVSLNVDQRLFDKVQTVVDAGFSVIEINITQAHFVPQLIEQFPHLKVGVAGIVTSQQLEECYQAGAHFISSPGFSAALAQTASIYSMNYLPGVATISEAMAAFNLGHKQVRIVPAQLAFCALLYKYIPELHLYPAEVSWDEAEQFFNLPTIKAVSIYNPDYKQLAALSNAVLV